MGYIDQSKLFEAVEFLGNTGERFIKSILTSIFDSVDEKRHHLEQLPSVHGLKEVANLAASFKKITQIEDDEEDDVSDEMIRKVVRQLPQMIKAFRSCMLVYLDMPDVKDKVSVQTLLRQANTLSECLLKSLSTDADDDLCQVDELLLHEALAPLHRLLFTLHLQQSKQKDFQYASAEILRQSLYGMLRGNFNAKDYAGAKCSIKQLYALEDINPKSGAEANPNAADRRAAPAAARRPVADPEFQFECPADIWLKRLHQVVPGYLTDSQVEGIRCATQDWDLKTVDGMKALVDSLKAVDARFKKGPRFWQQPENTLPYFKAALASFGWQLKNDRNRLENLYQTFHPEDRSTLNGRLGVTADTWENGFKPLERAEAVVPPAEIADAFDYLLCTLNGRAPVVWKGFHLGAWQVRQRLFGGSKGSETENEHAKVSEI